MDGGRSESAGMRAKPTLVESGAMAAVTVYTTPYCGFCFALTRLLDSLGIAYDEVSVEGRPEVRARLAADNGGWRTVPMVFVGGRFVGGFVDVRALHARGELIPLVEAARARAAGAPR
jgi:glutaredoxin 3